ncbi:MAG: DUF6502 family protein [Proteobacteria bacterium]|nr:DUF6502 family protein [Pseudomonadota bacterium]
MAASLRLLAPLVDMLLSEGITYSHFSQALKQVFLEAAASALEDRDARVNDSKISLLSGVHRKDVREWRNAGHPITPVKTLSLAMKVFTSWVSDPAYRDKRGQPKVLVRAGKRGSFEDLVTSISTDVHPRAVLEELIRLGVVVTESEGKDTSSTLLRLCKTAFVPQGGYGEMLQVLADNIGDHIAAAARNVEGRDPPVLEQAIFADGLTADSAGALAALARKQWDSTFRVFVREAIALSKRDKGRADADQRIRLGSYFFHDSMKTKP